MPHTSFEYLAHDTYTGHGSLLEVLKFLPQNNLVTSINYLVKVFQKIRTDYLHSVAPDGQLIGTERINLIHEFNHLLNLIIIIWKHLEGFDNDISILIKDYQKQFSFGLSESNQNWKASGKLSGISNFNNANFQDLFNKNLLPELGHFLREYKAACEDHFLSEEERSSMKKALETIIYTILIFRFKLELCVIDR